MENVFTFAMMLAIFLPVAGAAIICVLADFGRDTIRAVALGTVIAALAAAALATVNYTPDAAGYDRAWLAGSEPGVDIRFNVGLDGLSLWMFGLSALLMLTAVLVSWDAIREKPATYYALLLLLETGMLGVFAARDIILFYVFFEFTLIPLFFLIGIWGSEARRYAAVKFFVYTLAGSVFTFLALLAIVLWDYYNSDAGVMTFSIPQLTADLQAHPIDYTLPYLNVDLQVCIFLALFAGFAIKVPLFPLHTWLPLAHVQAPAAGSVLLAGVLLKIGTYGFLRFNIPMLPEATARCAPWLLWLSVAGIIYGALVALAQTDMKRLIAYSSVSHLGFCMLGIFALNPLGVQGGTLQMINHGLSTGGLFAVVGLLYERYHTREIRDLSGIARRTPILAFFMLVFTFSSIGLPGLNGFAGEFLLLLGMFQRAWAEEPIAGQFALRVISVLAVSGVVLGAWYMLWLVQRVFFGPLREPHHGGEDEPVRDLNVREIFVLAPLCVFIVWIGIQPRLFLAPMASELDRLSAPAATALEERLRLPATESGTAIAADDSGERIRAD